MPMNAVYRGPIDLPENIAVFPLPGALLLPRGQMPLNIFEPRYLAMVDDSLRDGHRLIGMIQPDPTHPGPQEKPNLFKIGCVGRITQLAETGDGRYVMQLTGVARFRVEQELNVRRRIASAASRSRRSPTISSRARARKRSTATPCSKRSPIFSKPTISRPTGPASRAHPTRPWSMRSP